MANIESTRFGIAEWYGESFVKATPDRRRELARLALAHEASARSAPPCPFMSGRDCSKKGGVCSLRSYRKTTDEKVLAESGVEGDVRVVCPHRFQQDGLIHSEVGRHLLGTTDPRVVTEVRFLKRPGTDDGPSKKSEDVGNIDCVLVHPDDSPLKWCALEIQAVYFSGTAMKGLFQHIEQCTDGGLPWPDAIRRPDYRSSGPKRLMPQLQIKVPTLRRWGRKMAVVVDEAWFRSNVVDVPTVSDVSNCDIAWFVARFNEAGSRIQIEFGRPHLQTLERAVEGLTGGLPVTLGEFEAKIRLKLGKSGN
jgi:hypothetical protein